MISVGIWLEYGKICKNNDHTCFFHCINTFQRHSDFLNARPICLVFKQLPRDPAYVNAWKNMCDPYSSRHWLHCNLVCDKIHLVRRQRIGSEWSEKLELNRISGSYARLRCACANSSHRFTLDVADFIFMFKNRFDDVNDIMFYDSIINLKFLNV